MKPEELVNYTVKAYVEKIGAPCENWSLFNKILTKFAGTSDARTFKNWQKVGRKIKSGSKAFYIWRPVSKMVKVYDERDMAKEEKDRHYTIRYMKMDDPLKENMVHIGIQFGMCPEFRIEDTEGEEIHYPNEPKEYPPLMNVAKQLGIKVSWAKFDNQEFAYYQPATKKIVLKAYDFETFFHELTHGIQHHLEKTIKGGQDLNQETVAEFTACVIANIYGIDTTKKTLTYITHYSGDKTQAMKNIDRNIHTVEKILDFVFKVENPVSTKKKRAPKKKELTVTVKGKVKK